MRDDELFSNVLTRIGQNENRLVTIETEVKKFDKLLTEGNGQPSILVQLALIRQEQDRLKLELAAKQVPYANKWQMGVMVACTIVSAVVALAIAVLGKYK